MRLKIVVLFAVFSSLGIGICDAQEYPRVKSTRAFLAADIVDGKINYGKVLGSQSLWSILELTDDQRLQMHELADRFFQMRQGALDFHLKNVNESDLTQIEKIKNASKSVFQFEAGIDVEHDLEQILLPHQIDLIQALLPLRFILNSIKNDRKDHSLVQVQANKSLAVLFGMEEKEVSLILDKMYAVKRGFYGKIREVIYQEFQSAFKLVAPDKRAQLDELLGFEKDRIELIAVSDLRLLISRRIAWQKGKTIRLAIKPRSINSFVNSTEKKWLNIDSGQEDELRKKWTNYSRKLWQTNQPQDEKDRKVMRFTIGGNGGSSFEGKQSKLYEIAGNVLLPEQMEELKRLDRWRLMNEEPFSRFLDVSDEQVMLSEKERNQFQKMYQANVLGNSLKKLLEIQEEQHRKFISLLPQQWSERLSEIGFENF